MMSASVRTQPGFEVTGRTPLFTGEYQPGNWRDHDYSVSRDGKSFVMLQRVVGTRQAMVVTLNGSTGFGRVSDRVLYPLRSRQRDGGAGVPSRG